MIIQVFWEGTNEDVISLVEDIRRTWNSLTKMVEWQLSEASLKCLCVGRILVYSQILVLVRQCLWEMNVTSNWPHRLVK